MFKTAATKLAHNSTIPALAGNSDLKPLQDIIATQKLVLQSLQKLSADFVKTSDALQAWARGEGDDLANTFSGCSILLNHWIQSLASFGSHIADIRECLKAVRTREEGFDDMHRRRKNLIAKADSAEKRLNKMNPENKNHRVQITVLAEIREEISTLNVDIMNEEADLGDYKRVKARQWMGVLFGALLECSEKGTAVAKFGRTIVGYVPTDKTQPGLARVRYTGHSQVGPLVVEAEQELHKISFASEIGNGSQQPSSEYQVGDIPGLPSFSSSSPEQPSPTKPYASSTLPSNQLDNPHELDDFGEYNPYSQSKTYAPGQRTRLSSLDQSPTASPTKSVHLPPYPSQGGPKIFSPDHKPRLSQSSTRSGPGFTPGYPPSVTAPAFRPTHSSNNTSVPGSFPERKVPPEDTFSSSFAKALDQSWGLEDRNTQPPYPNADVPPPSYAINNISTSGPPNPIGPSRVERKPVPVHVREPNSEEDDGVSLSYLNPSLEDNSDRGPEEKRLSDNSSREDRKVRWGSVRDVDAELEKRRSGEARESNEMRRSVSPGQLPQTPSPAHRSRSPSPSVPMPMPHPHVHNPTDDYPTESPSSLGESLSLPNPNASIENEGPSQPDEKSLNAVAAREISKELELSGSPLFPPSLPFAGRKSVSPRPSFTTDTSALNNNSSFGQIPPLPQHFSSMQEGDTTPTPSLLQPQLQALPPPPLPHSTSTDSTVSDPARVDDAYHTPPEYLRDASMPPSPPIAPPPPPKLAQVAPSINSSPPTPTTTKKIFAAAFRRPGMKGPSSTNSMGDPPRQDSLSTSFRPGRGSSSQERGDDGDVGGIPETTITPLNLRKKTLPMAPRTTGSNLSGPRDPGTSRSVSSPFPDLRTSGERTSGRVTSSRTPEPGPRHSTLGDEEFDYVSAYLNGDEGQSGVHNVATNEHYHGGDGPV